MRLAQEQMAEWDLLLHAAILKTQEGVQYDRFLRATQSN